MFRSSRDCWICRCRKANLRRSFHTPKGHAGLRAPGKKKGRKNAAPLLSAPAADGSLAACFDAYSVGFGKFSARAADRAQSLRVGLPISSFSPNGGDIDKEVDLLVRRLAHSGLLEY